MLKLAYVIQGTSFVSFIQSECQYVTDAQEDLGKVAMEFFKQDPELDSLIICAFDYENKQSCMFEYTIERKVACTIC
jgi:hypothetical protein